MLAEIIPPGVCACVLAQLASYGGVKHVARRTSQFIAGPNTIVLSAALDQKLYDDATTLTKKLCRNKEARKIYGLRHKTKLNMV